MKKKGGGDGHSPYHARHHGTPGKLPKGPHSNYFDNSHADHNAGHGLPADMYGHGQEGYQHGGEGDNETCE